MAIAYDTYGTGGSSAPASSITYSHTVTGSNPGILCFVWVGDGLSAGSHLTGITYNSVATTSVEAYAVPGNRYLYANKLTACATGANNVVVSFNNSPYADAQSLSYTGVDQTDMEDVSGTATGTSTATLTLTTTVDDCWLVSGASNLNFGTATASTGTTLRDDHGNLSVGDSNGSVGTAGAGKSMAWTRASGATYVAGLAIKPAAGGAAFVPKVSFIM